MSDSKDRHYALKTPSGYLAMDVRTNQLEIYEDWQIAVDNSQGCDVVAVDVYGPRQIKAIEEVYEFLEEVSANWHDYPIGDRAYELLEKARGEL